MFHNRAFQQRSILMRCLHRQHGVTIIAAIFMLLLLSAIAALMVTLSMSQNTASAQDVQGARAYQAARAGMEWGIYQVMVPENANTLVAPHTVPAACPGVTNLNALGGSLAGFQVMVSCTLANTIEGDSTVRVYSITSTATRVGAAVSVERQISASVATCRQSTGANC